MRIIGLTREDKIRNEYKIIGNIGEASTVEQNTRELIEIPPACVKRQKQ